MAFDYSSVKNKKRKDGKTSGFDYSSVVGKTQRTEEEKMEYVRQQNAQKNDVRNRPDYAVVSKKGRTNYENFLNEKTETGFGNWISKTDAAKVWIPSWDRYTEDEKNMYGYLLETDKEKARDYMLEVNRAYQDADRKKVTDRVSEWAEDKPFLASAASLVANIGAPVDYIKNIGTAQATEFVDGEATIMPNAGPSGIAGAMQKGVQKRIEENTDVEVLGANVAAQLYGMGMSIANSAALITAMGPLAVVEMSMQAAASATNEALDRGVSDVQAVKYGTAAGVAEALGEYLSIEHLFKLKSPHTIKQAIKSALAQAGVEASEEAVTTVMNSISDFVINGDKSEYATQVAFYLSEGYSQKEAEGKATWDSIKGLTWDAIGGAVSGLVLSGGSMALGSVFGNKQQENDARKAVKDLGKDRNKVLDFAMKTEEGSEVRKAAEDIVARTEKGEKVSNKEYADLLKKANTEYETAEIKKQLKSEAMSTGETLTDEQLDSMSTAVLKTIKGKMVSEQENAQIEQSKTAKNVYARNTGRDYAYGEGLSKEEAKKLVDSREQQIIAEVTADQNEENQKAVSEAYSEYAQSDAQLKIDAESFAEMFGSFYESGKVGYTSVDKALNTYKNIDTNLKNAFSKAYELGKADLEADNVAQNEFRRAAAKKGVEGKIVFEGEARRAAKNKQQTTVLEFMGRVLKKSAGIEYHVFSSYILEEDLTYTNKEGETVELEAGSRVYKDGNGEIVSAPSGFYDAESRQIWIDLNAGAEGIGLMLDTLAHEHVHDIRVWSYKHYKQLLDITKESIEARGVDFDDVVYEMYDLYHNKKGHKDYTIEKAKEEVVAKTMSGLLRDENGLREFSQQVYAKDRTLWEKIKDWFADVVARLTNAYKDVDLDSALAQNLKDQKELYERAQKVFAEAVVQAGQNYKAVESGAFKGLYKTTEGNSDVYVTEKGNVIAVSEKGNANNVMYNIGEYRESGKKILENWLNSIDKKTGKRIVDDKTRDQILTSMNYAVEIVEALEKNIPIFKEWGEVGITFDDSGKPVMRCRVKNGEYEINFDFSTVCKKRKALDAVLNNLVKTGKINLLDLSKSDIQFINDTLNSPKYGFEIACGLCFVDSKRYRVGEWAHNAASMYNDIVQSLVKPEDMNKIMDFNFGGDKSRTVIEGDISTWDDSLLDFSTIDNILATESNAEGMGYRKAFAKLIKNNPKYRKLLLSSDIISSVGSDKMRNEASDLLAAVNAVGGTSKPKMSFSESIYDHSVILDTRVDKKTAYAMGGARTQSFSDFIATMFFDYCQMFAEAAGKGLPMQAYTKELAFAKLFGLTGIRINLSVLHGVNISAEDRAWLDSMYKYDKDGKLVLKIGKGKKNLERYNRIRENAGLDANGNYVYEQQSIDFDEAVKLQTTNGYSKFLGTIVVGISEKHIWKLLDDAKVRMIIPYHKSGLSAVIAKARNIDCYNDFTKHQNTRFGESWGKDAGKTKSSKELLKTTKERLAEMKENGEEWDFYSVLHAYEEEWDTKTNSWKKGTGHADTITYEMDSNGISTFKNDPMRQTCEDYLAWCEKFDMIPQFEQFIKHPNYYKMQEDFDVYDCITGEYVPQTAVKFKLPSIKKGDAFDAQDVLKAELEAQQETSDRLNEKMPEMVDEIVNTIGRKIPPEIKIGKMMNERDSDGNILSKGQQEYFKDSKVRDEQGRLKPVYHGTERGGFTRFEITDDIGYFFTDRLSVARTYSGTYDEFAPAKFNSWDEAMAYAKDMDIDIHPEWYVYTDGMYGEHAESDNYESLEDLKDDWELEDGEKIKKVYVVDGTEFQEDELQDVADEILSYMDSNTNYNVYLNLKDPLIVEGGGSNWNAVLNHTGTMVTYDELTEEQKEAIADNMGFEVDELWDAHDDYGDPLAVYDIDNLWMNNPMTTREWVQEAVEGEYDGVIFKDISDEGKYGSYGNESTVYVALKPEQIKSVNNKNPTENPDIRYSLREVKPVQPTSDKWTRTLTTPEVMERFPNLWNVAAEESDTRNPTQITGTVRSYRKIYDFLKNEGFSGKILDASSGLGYGTKAGIEEYGFDVEDIEPYPDKNYHPKYKDYSSLNKKYDVIISNAVLNVIPQDQRDALVVKMGELLDEGGRMFINVRGKDVENASSKVAINEDLMEYYISNTGSYQKGFTKSELVAYLRDALGDGYTVESTNMFGAVSAVVTRKAGEMSTKGTNIKYSNRDWKPVLDKEEWQIVNYKELNYDERISTFDDQLLALENKNKKLVKEMENLMLKYEAAQDRAKKNILAGQMAQGKKDAEQLRKTTEHYQEMIDRRDQKLDQQSRDFKEALKAKDKESKLAQDYARAEGVLAGQMAQGAEDAKVIREIEGLLQKKKAELKKVRERRDEILEEKKQAYAAYREKTRESIASGGLRKSVERNTKTLYDWLMKNSDKEHVPEVLKTTVGDFLETIDFTSKRGLAGGEATKKDQAFAQRLNNLAAMLEKQRNYMNKANEGDAENPLDCFLDLPEGFAEEVRKLADDVAKTAIGGNFVVNEMNSAQLAQLNKALRILKTSISKMNKLITNAHFASVTEAARSSMLEMAEYKAHKPMNDISEQADKMLKWEMFTPVYAFKRYGSAGESIFKGIQKGWSDFAFAIDKVLKFTEGTYTDKEVEAWEKETHSIKLSDGKTVTLTTAQLMSLYCLNKREQARGHIYGGGIRIADIKEGKVKIQQTEPYLVSFEDVETLIAELSDRQIAVADKLQKFMTEQGSEWGNKVSMERFGYRAFTEENYFPIESDANNLIAIDPEAKANDMFRLLNMSATKSLTKGANNAIVISDIFDIFSNHMSDMAKYGSLALPILDTMKWYNYKVRYDVGDGQFRTETVQKSVERAYGQAGKSYFTNFMKDLNGVKEGGRGIGLVSKMVSNYKIASVGANLRVALLQPTSIVRACMEIEPKYILQALTKAPAAKKAESKSGIALWKSLGFYNTDIARGVREQIKHGGTTVDKVRDKSMFLAEQMDRVTFGTLWNAAEAKAKDLGYSGEELDVKTTEIFENIIYKTQVVDSTITRSSLMRSTNEAVKSITAFMAEPILSYNMVAETVYDMAKERDFSTGWQKNSKRFGKAVAIYAATSIAAAVIESIPDAFRDDDDDEWFGQKWWQAFWGERFWDGNLWSEINVLEKIPLLKDFISVRKGYDIQRLDAAWMSSLNKAIEINTELYNVYVKGEKPTKTTYWGNMTTYGAAYANLRAISQIAGLPVSNTVRDVVAIWNTIVGRMAPSLKLKTYDDSKK